MILKVFVQSDLYVHVCTGIVITNGADIVQFKSSEVNSTAADTVRNREIKECNVARPQGCTD